ncbi:SDR family oxidoreductase [Cryptosporangium aurantiacum]|uniref:NAD(P)-dependent dehydrogenase, short-chain alcohol dehydrogenase family n=1 Tax=Cryptosporangium aurantiacum TaxID=134849 RepID=A0A1M7R438_9ACTN|nr:SDR family oxidoreductase [Cryptosporangium aurantiacum]SHN39924.1 NAD(P)-dependent dehydrogenase, short-chain alcohol dehydrogenase family [Cryptosporangium aurantiacum]
MKTPDRTGLPLAIVIGGSGGMGQACARRLGERHAVVLANRNVGKGEEVADDLRSEGIVATPIACDLTDPPSVKAMVDEAVGRFGPVRVLAGVAGLSPSMGDARRILAVNLGGTATVLEAALPHMAAGGAAVVVSSIAGVTSAPAAEVTAPLDDPLSPTLVDDVEAALGREMTTEDAYRLSKFGENRMVRRSVVRFAERGARIVSLTPGLIRTPMGAREFERMPAKWDLLRRIPLGREGMLTEICDALEFLVSDRASYITGTDLVIDGGIVSALEFGLGRDAEPR